VSEDKKPEEAQNQQPIFSVQKIYTKDISFENPNSPKTFGAEKQPRIELNLGVNHRQIDENFWEVSLKVTALARADEDDSVVFEVEVEHAGLFLLKNIPEEHIPQLLAVDCPTIIFPFTRQLISTLTADGGYIPLMLDPFNFAVAYQQSLEQQGLDPQNPEQQHTTH